MGPPYPPWVILRGAERNLQKTVALFQPRDVLTDLQCSYVYSQVTASRIACVDLAQIILLRNFAPAVMSIIHHTKRKSQIKKKPHKLGGDPVTCGDVIIVPRRFDRRNPSLLTLHHHDHPIHRRKDHPNGNNQTARTQRILGNADQLRQDIYRQTPHYAGSARNPRHNRLFTYRTFYRNRSQTTERTLHRHTTRRPKRT